MLEYLFINLFKLVFQTIDKRNTKEFLKLQPF